MDWPDVTYDRVGNILLSRLMGADVRLDPGRLRHRVQGELGAGARRRRGARRQAVRDPGRRLGPPAGRPRVRRLGVRGRGAGARARRLLRHDRRVLGHRVDAGRDDRRVRRPRGRRRPPRRVIGIDGSATPLETRDQVGRIARRTAAAIGLGRDLRDDEIILDDRYHAGVYGIPDEATLEAMRLAARLEGMITDPVYEGKSMAGLIDLVARGEIGRGLQRPLRAPRRAARDQRVRVAVQLTGRGNGPWQDRAATTAPVGVPCVRRGTPGGPSPVMPAGDDNPRMGAAEPLAAPGRSRGSGGVLARLPAVVWESETLDERMTFVSQRARDLLGHDPDTWRDTPRFWQDHLHPDDRGRVLAAIRAGHRRRRRDRPRPLPLPGLRRRLPPVPGHHHASRRRPGAASSSPA